MFRFGMKLALKNYSFCSTSKTYLSRIRIRIRIQIFKTGSADQDTKKRTGSATLVYTNKCECYNEIIQKTYIYHSRNNLILTKNLHINDIRFPKAMLL